MSDQPKLAPVDPPVVIAMAQAIWTAYQAKFTRHQPDNAAWDRAYGQVISEPDIGHPFEDAAIEAARNAYVLAFKEIRKKD